MNKERDKLADEMGHLTEAMRHLDYSSQQAKRPLKVSIFLYAIYRFYECVKHVVPKIIIY